MDTSQWLITYVVLFGLLQFLLYYLYRRRNSRETRQSLGLSMANEAEHTPTGTPTQHPPPEADDEDTDTVYCQNCGTKNVFDATYTYCWNCTERLGA